MRDEVCLRHILDAIEDVPGYAEKPWNETFHH